MAATAILNDKKSRYLGNGLTDRHEICDTPDASHSSKFLISKIQDGGGRHSENAKNRHISAAV